jgi:hypothetical protein
MESAPTHDARLREAAAVFGPAGRRVEQLAKDLAAARAAAVLEDLQARPDDLGREDAAATFAALQRLLESHPEAERRPQMLEGLFGPRGPQVYAAAAAVHEGIDHEWVFRYERDASGP